MVTADDVVADAASSSMTADAATTASSVRTTSVDDKKTDHHHHQQQQQQDSVNVVTDDSSQITSGTVSENHFSVADTKHSSSCQFGVEDQPNDVTQADSEHDAASRELTQEEGRRLCC